MKLSYVVSSSIFFSRLVSAGAGVDEGWQDDGGALRGAGSFFFF